MENEYEYLLEKLQRGSKLTPTERARAAVLFHWEDEKENEFVSPTPCDDCGKTIEQFDGKTVCDECLAAYIARVYPNGLDCY